MDFNNLERKTKAELFELIRSKQEEVNRLQVQIDELKKKIDSVKELSEHWYRSSGSALALNILELLK